MTAGSGAGHGGLDALGAYRFHRLLTVPRRPEDPARKTVRPPS